MTAKLRPLTKADLPKILIWRNDQKIRSVMLAKHIITEQEHIKWFENSTNNKSHHLFMYCQNSKPLGFVQFNKHDSHNANWGFYKSPNAPNGVGFSMCKLAISYARANLNIKTINAKIINNNAASLHLHKKLGFIEREIIDNSITFRLDIQ